jgi:glycine oxidase
MNVAVAGGGVIGLSIAWRLATAGVRVDLVDAGPCGGGASTAALGALWPASPLMAGPLQELHRASLWQFPAFAADISAAAGIPISLRRLGRVELLNSPKAEAAARAQAAHACGHWPAFADPLPTMEVVPPDAVPALVPGLPRPAHAALVCRATAQVNVHHLLAALRVACERAGVHIREHTPVTGLHHRGGRIVALGTAGGPVEADAFVLAAGAWTPHLSPLVGPVAPVRPVKGQGLALARPAGLALNTILKSGPIYVLPWEDELLVGSTTEPDAGFDLAPTPAARAALLAGATALLPALAAAPVLRHWAGLRPQTRPKPHPPVIGPHADFPNLHLCTGHYKTGIGLAPLVSSLMATALITHTPPDALTPFLPKTP